MYTKITDNNIIIKVYDEGCPFNNIKMHSSFIKDYIKSYFPMYPETSCEEIEKNLKEDGCFVFCGNVFTAEDVTTDSDVVR